MKWVIQTKVYYNSFSFLFSFFCLLKAVFLRHLYKCVTAAWTIQDQEQLEAAKEDFDIYIFDSFIPS